MSHRLKRITAIKLGESIGLKTCLLPTRTSTRNHNPNDHHSTQSNHPVEKLICGSQRPWFAHGAAPQTVNCTHKLSTPKSQTQEILTWYMGIKTHKIDSTYIFWMEGLGTSRSYLITIPLSVGLIWKGYHLITIIVNHLYNCICTILYAHVPGKSSNAQPLSCQRHRLYPRQHPRLHQPRDASCNRWRASGCHWILHMSSN